MIRVGSAQLWWLTRIDRRRDLLRVVVSFRIVCSRKRGSTSVRCVCCAELCGVALCVVLRGCCLLVLLYIFRSDLFAWSSFSVFWLGLGRCAPGRTLCNRFGSASTSVCLLARWFMCAQMQVKRDFLSGFWLASGYSTELGESRLWSRCPLKGFTLFFLLDRKVILLLGFLNKFKRFLSC